MEKIRHPRSSRARCSLLPSATTSDQAHHSKPGQEAQLPVAVCPAQVSIDSIECLFLTITSHLSSGWIIDPVSNPRKHDNKYYIDISTDSQALSFSTGDTDKQTTYSPDHTCDSNVGGRIELALDAYCCGALGCRTTENLLSVTIDGYGTRVVCLDHAELLVFREGC